MVIINFHARKKTYGLKLDSKDTNRIHGHEQACIEVIISFPLKQKGFGTDIGRSQTHCIKKSTKEKHRNKHEIVHADIMLRTPVCGKSLGEPCNAMRIFMNYFEYMNLTGKVGKKIR